MGRIYKPKPPRPRRSGQSPKSRERLAVHIGQKLLALRQRDLLTIRAVGDRCGLSNAFICQMENGDSMPSADSLWRLACAFKVPVGHFFEGYKLHSPEVGP